MKILRFSLRRNWGMHGDWGDGVFDETIFCVGEWERIAIDGLLFLNGRYII